MNTTETFVMFYRDPRTTTFAWIRTNVSSPSPRSAFMATSWAPVVSNLTQRRLKRSRMEALCRMPVTQYVSRFISNYATITAPLRFLTRQDTPWKWEQEEQKAVEELKEAWSETNSVYHLSTKMVQLNPPEKMEIFGRITLFPFQPEWPENRCTICELPLDSVRLGTFSRLSLKSFQNRCLSSVGMHSVCNNIGKHHPVLKSRLYRWVNDEF